jgi:membrane protein DedA with SNARE-associated domain
MEVLSLVISLLQQYTYTFLFIGIFIAGEIVLVPAAYLTVVDVLSPIGVLATVALVSIIADSMWYWIGRTVGWERLCRLPLLCKQRDRLECMTPLFRFHGAKTVFLSHFIFGTRNIVQVLCGMHHTPFMSYMSASFAGSLVWAGILLSVVQVVEVSLAQFMDTAQHIELVAAIAAGCVGGTLLLAHRLIARRVMQEQ